MEIGEKIKGLDKAKDNHKDPKDTKETCLSKFETDGHKSCTKGKSMEAVMFSESMALLALLVIHFGFAALLGGLVRRIQSIKEGIVVACLSLLYLAATLTLPLPLWAAALVLLCSFFLGTLSASRIPRTLFQPRIGWLYASGAMALILIWSAAQGWQYPLLTLGAAAGLAATLAWRRGLRI